METFALQHSGAFQHAHTVRIDVSASGAAMARELRIAVVTIVAGWVAVTGIRAWYANRAAN